MTTTDVLIGGGALGDLLRGLDWAATPFGDPQGWPQSLRSAASICLNSRFPIAIYWGPQLALLYNEAWSPILGDKHPWALGRPGHVVWPEIWPEVGPLFASVHGTGEGVWQQDQLLPMHRHGYTEECYFNFTFSPIRGEDGTVAGIFNAVIETTFRVLEERRAQLLRDLAEGMTGAHSTEDVCVRAAAALGAAPADLPFSLLYLRRPGAPTFHLAAAAAPPDARLAPPVLDSADPAAPWPTGATTVVSGLSARLGAAVPSGAWPEPVEQALVVPIAGGGAAEPAALLVAGISPRRALDDAYASFVERAAQQIGGALVVADAYAAERRRAEALAAIDAAKTAFFSNVSHEFRTPLTLLLGPLEDTLARPDALDPDDRERLEVAHRNGLRLLRLVNTLLDFSRIEAGRARAAYAPTDLGAFTAELASVFRSAVERAGLRFLVECPPLPAPAYVDREMWEQIVFNLLSNALKFTLEGEIAISLRQAGAVLDLTVRDTGAGIPAEELPRLFERFHRVQGARGRTFEGSGIGLALVQELTSLHGGTVLVSSVLGQGTTFVVSIPAGSAHLPQDRVVDGSALPAPGPRGAAYVQEALRWLPDPEPAGAPPAAGTAPSRPAGRVLLADDNADMREYVRRLLSPHYEVVAVGDGLAALRAARAAPFDLVLSDVMMPGLDGFGLLQALRADEATSALPVVLLSARAGEEARVEGMEAGADDYLVKPFSARELLARVGARIEIARVRRHAARRERELGAEAAAARVQLERVLSGINDQFFALDAEWRYVYANDHVSRVTGLPREQLIGRNVWELFPDLRGSAFERELRRVVAEGTPAHFAYFYAHSGRWYENRIYPADGGLALLVADITDRKRVELNTQFLLEVGEALARATAADALLEPLAAQIGAFFGADHCALVTIDAAADTAIFVHDWRANPADISFAGVHRARDFVGDEARRTLAAGLPLAVHDIAADPRTADSAARYRALGVGAYLCAPFVSDGALRATLTLFRREPYRWRDDEVATLRDLAARVWAHVERARAEEALRAGEAKLQAALDGGRLGAWSWDPRTNQVEVDQLARELFALGPDELDGDAGPLFDRIHPDDRAHVQEALGRAVRPGGVYEAEFRVLLPDGRVRWLTGAGRGRAGADGQVQRIYGVNADVSDRKQAEAALREAQIRRLAEEQAHAARVQWLNVASLAIVAAPTRDELLRRIAAEARSLIDAEHAVLTPLAPAGWEPAESVRAPDGAAEGPAPSPFLVDAVARVVCAERRALRLGRGDVLGPGGPAAGQDEPDWPAGGVLAAPLLGRDGACLAVIQLVGRPAEPFGAADEGLLQQLAQIAAVALENRTLYEQEQAARAQAEEASRLKDEFLATVSHELRTPLTALLGYAQLLQSRKRDEAYIARTVEKIARSARAQAQITEDLLDVARIVSGKLRIEPRPIDLGAVVLAALETVRPALEAKGLRLEIDMGLEPGRVVGDANRLQQVVWNLLSNAAKFTPAGGLVSVRLERDAHEARLTVSDTGQGISPSFLPFVFDRFRQADSSSQRAQGGLGLGLAIVRHLVELHGGTAEATSRGPGMGAAFTVRLPLAQALADLPAAGAEPDDRLEDCPPELRGLRVLVVDDQPEILELLEEILAPCGATVVTCDSARAALARLRAWRPDLLVSDIAMPGEDGYWLIRAVRELAPEQGGATPAVALTAYVRVDDRLRVLEAGFQQYVPKPVEPDELRAVLAGVVRAEPAA
jgi:PAS domain S-box-containing protein